MTYYGPKPLTPAQIQYLRIGPKTGGSELTKKQICQAVRQKNKQVNGNVSATNSFNKIPKLTYGEFQKTVSNFGVLINKNFGNETTVHQSQKFGKIAQNIDRIMLQEKDKPVYSEKKNTILKKIKDRSDNRTTINKVYNLAGEKLSVTLKSFTVESEKSNEEGLPIPYLKFLIHHVNSLRLVKIIESSIRSEGNQIVVEFDKIENRALHFANNEVKYQNIEYSFQRMGQLFKISLPYVEFQHAESNYSQRVQLLNKEIIEIVETTFNNVGSIVDKYLETAALKQAIQQKKQEELRLKEETDKEMKRRLLLKKEYENGEHNEAHQNEQQQHKQQQLQNKEKQIEEQQDKEHQKEQQHQEQKHQEHQQQLQLHEKYQNNEHEQDEQFHEFDSENN